MYLLSNAVFFPSLIFSGKIKAKILRKMEKHTPKQKKDGLPKKDSPCNFGETFIINQQQACNYRH